jgi:DNA-binding MarR family transcriptional regulator
MIMDGTDEGLPSRLQAFGPAFLLSQLGFQSSRLWRARLAPYGLGPREAIMLLHLAIDEGRSQRALAEALGVSPSLIVGVVDTLASLGLVERRQQETDRRVHALHVSARGKRIVAKLREESRAHDDDLCVGLSPSERARLAQLLSRIAASHGLATAVHPGFADTKGKTWGRGVGAT